MFVGVLVGVTVGTVVFIGVGNGVPVETVVDVGVKLTGVPDNVAVFVRVGVAELDTPVGDKVDVDVTEPTVVVVVEVEVSVALCVGVAKKSPLAESAATIGTRKTYDCCAWLTSETAKAIKTKPRIASVAGRTNLNTLPILQCICPLLCAKKHLGSPPRVWGRRLGKLVRR